MHTLLLQTKYTFGDRVRFDSPTQRCSGTGTIVAIVTYREGPIDYMLEVDGRSEIQGGIQEDEMTLLGDDA
jgi:hypothetical protein